MLKLQNTQEFQDALANRKAVVPSPRDLSALVRRAGNFLKGQLDQLAKDDPDFLVPDSDQIEKASEFAAQEAIKQEPVKQPSQIHGVLLDQLVARARELAADTLKTTAREALISSLFGIPDPKATEEAIRLVATGLQRFLRDRRQRSGVGSAPATAQEAAAEQAFLDKIARAAVGDRDVSDPTARSLEAARLQIELTEAIAENVLDLSSEIDVPGIRNRRVTYREVLAKLSTAALPGTPFTGFGRRRTLVLAPNPLDPDLDYISIDAGDHIPYGEIRRDLVSHFIQLIDRERIILGTDPETGMPVTAAGLDLNPNFLRTSRAMGKDDRFTQQRLAFEMAIEQIRRNRIENLIVVVPPDGLSLNLSDTLEAVRTLVLDGSDVRVDLVLVGYATVPLRFRDMVAQTGGSVQVIGDVDELGLIAQRIKNDVALGSWISRPQQGYIDLSVGGSHEDRSARTRSSAAPRGDPANLCNQRRPARIAPVLDRSRKQIWDFEELASFVIDNFKRKQYVPSEYEQVTKTLNGLIDLSDSTVRFRDRLNALDSQLTSTTLESEVDEILTNVRTAKRQLRDLYGSSR